MFKHATVAVLAGIAFAGQLAAAEPAPGVPTPELSVGGALVISDSEFAGEGSRILALPVVTYESERFFITGPQAGIHLYQDGGFSFDTTLGARFSGWDAKDLGRAELAQRGVDRDLLKDRDYSADLGLAASWLGAYGKFDVGLTTDVLGVSDGQELSLEYTAAVDFAGGQLLPGATVSYWSDNLANYYYGTLASEIARGVPNYQPGAFVMPSARLGYLRTLGVDWQLYAAVDYRFLPNEVSDSPLVERGKDGAATATFALVRKF